MQYIILKSTSLLCAALALSACATQISHGNKCAADTSIGEKVKIGKTREMEILKTLGSPSIIEDSFGPRTFFYIQQKFKSRPITIPHLINQDVLEIAFNQNHVVKSVKYYDINDANEVQYCQDKIVVKANEMGIFEQLIKNIGRFKKPSNQYR